MMVALSRIGGDGDVAKLSISTPPALIGGDKRRSKLEATRRPARFRNGKHILPSEHAKLELSSPVPPLCIRAKCLARVHWPRARSEPQVLHAACGTPSHGPGAACDEPLTECIGLLFCYQRQFACEAD